MLDAEDQRDTTSRVVSHEGRPLEAEHVEQAQDRRGLCA